MELPRDRDGVEIDVTETAVLYAMDGTVRHVDSFNVQPCCGMWTVKLREHVEDCAPSNFTVASHDSWEFLLEDLDRNVFSARDACSYFGSCGDCADCRNKDTSMGCIAAMLKDIAKRIRKLRGGMPNEHRATKRRRGARDSVGYKDSVHRRRQAS